VIDGTMVPWEVAPAIKLQEVAKYHLDNPPDRPRMSNSIFVVAMNQAKYDSLPPDLKKVIDANSGLETSKMIGKAFDATTAPGRKLAADAGGVFDTLSPAEYDRWRKATESVDKEWIGDVTAKGANGQSLYDDAKALIRKYGG
jgi:TRAP-type C4-dicarboxylate transport system substrate-binding protein